MDTRRWGPGERIVFEPYTREVFEESFEWIARHAIFPEGQMGACNYGAAVVSMAGAQGIRLCACMSMAV